MQVDRVLIFVHIKEYSGKKCINYYKSRKEIRRVLHFIAMHDLPKELKEWRIYMA